MWTHLSPRGATLHCSTMRKAKDAPRITISEESFGDMWIQSRRRYCGTRRNYRRPRARGRTWRTNTLQRRHQKEIRRGLCRRRTHFRGKVFVMHNCARKLAKFWQRHSKTDARAADPQSANTSCDDRRKRTFICTVWLIVYDSSTRTQKVLWWTFIPWKQLWYWGKWIWLVSVTIFP